MQNHLYTKIGYCFIFILLVITSISAQPTQILKGKVVDRDAKTPLIGVTVFLADSLLGLGTSTNEEGDFRLEGVPVGRQTLVFQMLGYEEYRSANLIVTSGKELETNVGMQEKLEKTGEVVIRAEKAKDKAVNEFATVSTRSFTAEQVQRYPATINDPGRMAMALPGVQASRDNNNDIIIRGNSPTGLLWRLEGIDIANPNHFARRGSSGGGITVFSLSLMAESDFNTGAFAPEYGNAFSGVFDMKFRKGNNEKREFTFRAGLIGLDLATEGPIQKGKSSYLVNYRYSTLGILNKMGVHLVGPRTNNTFQDLSFNLNFKTSKNGNFSIFGIGGLSSELTSVEKTDSLLRQTYDNRLKTDFITHTGAIGATYTHLLDDKSYIRAVAVLSASKVINQEDSLSLNQKDQYFRMNNEVYLNGNGSITVFYNRKFNARTTLKTGILASDLFYNTLQYRYNFVSTNTETVVNGKGSAFLLQPYLQVKHRFTEKLTFTGGLHGMHFLLNNTSSLEPRAAFSYQISPKQDIHFAYGLHGQVVPLGSYFTEVNGTLPNKNLKLIKAHHLVLSYNHTFTGNYRLKIEPYLQLLYNVPVAADVNSTYSPLNDRDGYAKVALVSKGTMENKGVDLTIEKFFANRFFFLVGASFYSSTYKPLNGKTYNTRYNGKYNTSLMVGKEFKMGKSSVLEVGGRVMYSGGLRYTPANYEETRKTGNYVGIDSLAFTQKVQDYFRIDTRIAARFNGKKVSHIVALDIQNISNQTNYSTFIFVAGASPDKQFIFRKQATLTPVISYVVDF